MSLGSDIDWICRANDAGINVQLVEEVLLFRRVHQANAWRLRVSHRRCHAVLRDIVQSEGAVEQAAEVLDFRCRSRQQASIQ